MADYFGEEQNRVVEVKDRNLDNVVFQYKHPPLTSEWNLINQIGNEKLQNLARMSLPSGWLHVEDILQDADEFSARAGNVLCSESYTETSFKLFSSNNNYAMVNGWPILVQNDLLENVIQLDTYPYTGYNNFVFLEVWRKLLGPSDKLRRYGNVDDIPYSDNEIKWDTVGCETTKRVQIQYRIRSYRVTSLFDCTKEVFENNPNILPQGGNDSPVMLGSGFLKYGPSDPGLFVAGDGSEEQKEYLSTVDGYVYAIPMFIVHRRRLSGSKFLSTTINTSMIKKGMSVGGYRSDRPDNRLLDVIYKDDIVDVRHRVMISDDLKNVADTTISKLLSGELTSAYSGGSSVMKVERLNSTSVDDIPDIGEGSYTQGSIFKRRAFCSAEIIRDHNIVEITTVGTWVGSSFSIASKVTLPPGEIVSVDGFYSDQGLVTGVSSDGVAITIEEDASIVGTSDLLYMEFTFKYSSSTYGIKDVPRRFIEVNKNDSVAIATKDADVLLKYNTAGQVINFGETSPVGYGYPDNGLNVLDKVHYCGGNYTDNPNIGHELVLTRTAINGIVNIPLSNYKYNQYYILGVKAIEKNSVVSSFDSVVLTNSSCIITINSLLSTPSSTVTVRLYTGSPVLSYTEADSLKFFEMSKQGKGIIDTYEMIMVTASKVGDYYVVDTGDKPIVKIATKINIETDAYGEYEDGKPFVFNSSGEMVLVSDLTINDRLPVLNSGSYTEGWLPTKISISVSGPTDPIKVPVLVHSYVAVTESPYNFYYSTNPYQGLLNTTSDFIYGKIIGECSALISSSGSGAIKDFSYSEGTVTVSNDRRITGTETLWESYATPGDYFRTIDSPYLFRVLSVVSDTEILLSEQYNGTPDTGLLYEIVRQDAPDTMISNVVDRLPALSTVSTVDITDYTCFSDDLEVASDYSSILMTSAKRKLQDPLNALTNDFILGQSADAKRGRNDFQMTAGGNSVFKVGSGRPYLIYPETSTMPAGHNKKVYQFYLFVRSGKSYHVTSDLTGKVYLMVVAGETVDSTKNLLNPFSNKDVVDIFELVGRPIIRG